MSFSSRLFIYNSFCCCCKFQAQDFVQQFPSFATDYLSCLLGESYIADSDECAASGYAYLCDRQLTSSLKAGGCHLDRYNKYRFKISVLVNVDDGGQQNVTLFAEDDLKVSSITKT